MSSPLGELRQRVRRRLPIRRVSHPICHDLRAWAAAESGAGYTLVEPARHVERRPPLTIEPGTDNNFDDLLSVDIPERAVVEIPSARIRGQVGAVVLANGEFVGELVAMTPAGRRQMLEPEAAYYAPLPRRPDRIMAGSFYPLVGFGYNNYFHFSHDMLMRLLGIIELLPDDIQLLIPAQTSGYHRELLNISGLDRFACVPLPEGELWQLERLFVALPLPKPHFDTPAHYTTFRSKALATVEGSDAMPKRLYVSRKDARHWRTLNEDVVASWLQSRGFATIVPSELSVRQQIAAFAAADIVVGTGAGLTNCMVCAPGTRIIQLQDPDHVAHSFFPMAEALGLDYSYFYCETVPNPGGANADVRVPMDKLLSALDAV